MRLLRIDHVQITVPRAREREARHFYGTVLGLAELAQPKTIPASILRYAFAQGNELHILLAADPFKPPSMDHFAVIAEEMEAVKARLAEHRVPHQPSPVPGALERILVQDPFGNRLEFLTFV